VLAAGRQERVRRLGPARRRPGDPAQGVRRPEAVRGSPPAAAGGRRLRPTAAHLRAPPGPAVRRCARGVRGGRRRRREQARVDGPHATLAGLLEFLGTPGRGGEDPLAFVADESLRLDTSHTVAGNPMRFASGTLRVVADEAWRTRFPTRSRTAVAAVTAPLRG